MTQAVFRETDPNLPQPQAGPLDADIWDTWLMLGLPAMTAGLALVWAPLALVVPGVVVTLLMVVHVLRRPS